MQIAGISNASCRNPGFAFGSYVVKNSDFQR